MTSDDLTFHPPRGELRRTGGGADCGVTRPRVRMRFAVEALGPMGRGPHALQLAVGDAPRLGEACGDAAAELATAAPDPVTLERGMRSVRKLRRGGRIELTGRLERGYGSDGRADACPPRPAAGDWECAVTSVTVRFHRVV